MRIKFKVEDPTCTGKEGTWRTLHLRKGRARRLPRPKCADPAPSIGTVPAYGGGAPEPFRGTEVFTYRPSSIALRCRGSLGAGFWIAGTAPEVPCRVTGSPCMLRPIVRIVAVKRERILRVSNISILSAYKRAADAPVGACVEALRLLLSRLCHRRSSETHGLLFRRRRVRSKDGTLACSAMSQEHHRRVVS